MKTSDLLPSLQADRATALRLGLKPHVTGKSAFTTQHGCHSCGGPLRFEANSGTKIHCKKCGRDGIQMSDLDKDVVSPSADFEPSAIPSTECPTTAQNGDSGHDLPVGKDSDTPEIEAPQSASVEPPRRIEEPEPEIPHGREPGSDDEPTAKPPCEPMKDTGFMWVDEFCKQPSETSWLVRSYLERDCLAVLFGDSQAGKSFVAIDLSLHIAHGLKWCGKRTHQGLVLYIAAEGKHGLKRRIMAWHEFHNLPLKRNMVVRTVPAKLCDIEHTKDLVKQIKLFLNEVNPVLIVVDTLNRNFGDGDENKTQDMSKFIDGMNELKLSTNACILTPHHVGHTNKERGRGSISLFNAVDFEYRVERTGDPDHVDTLQTVMVPTKWKDSAKPKELAWNWNLQDLPWMELDDDDNWKPVNSVVFTPTEYDPQAKDAALPYPQQIALKAIGCALVTAGVEANGLVTVDKEQWRQSAYELEISKGEQDAKRKAFDRAMKELLAAGRVRNHEGRYWIPVNRTSRT